MSKREINVISTFSGAGGMDIGFERVDEISVKALIEKDNACCETLRANFSGKAVIEKDIRSVSASEILEKCGLNREDVDILIGGPPCQTFSKSNNGDRKGIVKEKGRLYEEFIRLIKELSPKAFLFENVPGLRSSNNGKALKDILGNMKEIRNGIYKVNYEVLNAANYGVPQKRRRLFIVGLRGEKEPKLPEKTHANNPDSESDLKPYKTAGDAIEDLDDEVNRKGSEEIGGKWGHLLDDIPPGENYQYYTERRKEEYGHDHDVLFEWRSRFWTFLLKLDPDRPSNTIQAQPGKYVGPFHWNNRRLTPIEKKRLMTIPDNWNIKGSKSDVNKQIGNAVPPDLAENLAETVRDQIKELN
ncbi:hypothetical protein AKJ64_00920 [candidate division MSBL1 archaeon SCGC-AAA259E17]|uniref:DNA (cytosine-5-)-methyltransferase n=1 Tax=candidate division MSBL1 archaeon SCGC-AAA259E17 TaxID=1698263 RepID=A0A133UGL9_9EURY|nr:hypothetical protein AKJ64_00920 [candidate division MSBL1 archaeon SCGC-AAA259E17]